MLTFLFLVASKPQTDPVARFDSYMKGAKTLSVNLEYTTSANKEIGKGSFHIRRPNLVLFKMKVGASDYSFSIGAQTIVAIERGKKLYREYGEIGQLFIPELDISETPEFSLPLALMAGSLHALVPNGVKTALSGKGTQDGQAVDFANAQFNTQTGKVFIRTKIDSLGRALHFEREFQGGGGTFITKIKVSDYKINHQLPDSFFETPLPVGFIPQTLPPEAFPLNNGEKMPLAGWKPSGGGRDLATLAAKKTLFVAVSDPACEVSKAASATVAAIAKEVSSKGGVSVGISLSDAGAQTAVFSSLPYFIDPTKKLTASLRAPGTPLFLLVTPKGLVSRIWYGFDPAKADEFKLDVVEWVNRPAPPLRE